MRNTHIWRCYTALPGMIPRSVFGDTCYRVQHLLASNLNADRSMSIKPHAASYLSTLL